MSEPLNKLVKQLEEIYLCPISLELMTDPILMRCGHTFQKDNIQHHLKVYKKDNCPLCKRVIKFQEGYRNLAAQQTLKYLKKELLAIQMQKKMGIFVRYRNGLKLVYLDKNATISDLFGYLGQILGVCSTNGEDAKMRLNISTTNGKCLNNLCSIQPKLELNQIINNNSTVNVSIRLTSKQISNL